MMNVNSVYTGLANLASRKTVSGLITFNNLVEAGLVRFLSAKEENVAKTVTVNLKELQQARQQAEKVLSTARATKGYRGVVAAKKAVLSTTGYGMTKDVARYLGISESLKDSTPRSMTAYGMMDADFVRKTPGFEGDITYVNYDQLEVTYNDLTFDFNFEETDVPF